MKLKNTLILFVIMVLLAGYVYIFEFKKYEEKQKTEQQSKKVLSFTEDSVRAIQFKNSNGEFEIKKIQGEWRITRPIYTEADPSTMTSIFSSLKNAQKEKVFGIQPGELSQYGLEPVSQWVRLVFNNEETDSLHLGDKTPVGEFVFCNRTDSSVFTTGINVKNTLDKKLFDLRFKKLLNFKRDQVRKISIQNQYGRFEFEKTGTDAWTIPSLQRPAGRNKVSAILSKMEYNNAKTFVDEEGSALSKFGLKNPRYRVELNLGPAQGVKRLFISRKMGGRYYARDDSRKPIFEIDSTVVKEINKKLDQFRDTDFAEFDRDEVDRIEINYADTSIVCVKEEGDKWRLNSDDRPEVKTGKINSFFSTLNYAPILEFVRDGEYREADYGLDTPSLSIKLFKADQLLLHARFGKEKGENVYAVTDKYKSVYLVAKFKVKDLRLKLDDLLKEVPAETSV